ncbi:TetR family transcriptional regulator [Subtercola sp. RTI3]|uniref:TetR family transcriptional regulator n=1 Tax=Subtercola sp. RTI3 TaxID=3048639 RepID=UPI002B225F6B|nr:TetR family transcriptional regulator [Subtercola sp. RTI3]MEA9986936.1 TetR family transcriptional regulator [Subtercola sp. RTI3]
MTLTTNEPAAAEPGLRERKRLATSRSIQLAVLELSRDRGLDAVTVDEISRHADISPRTFFNYFPSKEAAVLGETPFRLESEQVEAFVSAGSNEPIFDGLLAIMHSVAVSDTADFEMHQLRKLVIRDYPHLLIQRISSMREFEVDLTGVVARRLTHDAESATHGGEIPDPAAIHDHARLITLVAIAAMRHAWGTWADSSDSRPMSVLLTNSFAELRTLL